MGLQCGLFILANALSFLLANAEELSTPVTSNEPFPISLTVRCEEELIVISDGSRGTVDHMYYVQGYECNTLIASAATYRSVGLWNQYCFPDSQQNNADKIIYITTRKPNLAGNLEDDYHRPTYNYTVNCARRTHKLEIITEVTSAFLSNNGVITTTDYNVYNTGFMEVEFDLILNRQYKYVHANVKECQLINPTDHSKLTIFDYCNPRNVQLNWISTLDFKYDENTKERVLHFKLRPYVYFDFETEIEFSCTLVGCDDQHCVTDPCRGLAK